MKFIKERIVLMIMARFIVKNNKLRITKKITKLDKFVIDTVGIASKYADYVIISGYVSIFFGRARATEDIDVFIKDMVFNKFSRMFDNFSSKKFDFTIQNKKSLYYDYLKNGLPINVWRRNFPLLRLEMKLASKKSHKQAFLKPVTVIFDGKKLKFTRIESQIAYKRYILKSEKDLEDARHLELVFGGLDNKLIQKYKKKFEYWMEHGE